MHQVNFVKKDNGFGNAETQAKVREMESQTFQRADTTAQLGGYQQTAGRIHACRASKREFQKARDRLRRANRDLGETAAFVAAALTTATAVQAVIGFAVEKIGLEEEEMTKLALAGYILIITGLVAIGALRGAHALYRRRRAERDFDSTKRGIFDNCPVEEWPKADE